MNEILYKYALDSNNNIININEVNSGKNYRCPKCGNKLIAKLGDVRHHHFSHYNQININCSSESYLHIIAKKIFCQKYKFCLENNLPFNLSIKNIDVIKYHFLNNKIYLTSEIGSGYSTIDLTEYYKDIKVECKIDDFIADILLIGNNDELLIEINVSHKSSKEKLENKNVIEIKIEDLEDVNLLYKNDLKENDTKIRLSNNLDKLRRKIIINRVISDQQNNVNNKLLALFKILKESEKNNESFSINLHKNYKKIIISNKNKSTPIINSSIKYIENVNLFQYYNRPELKSDNVYYYIEFKSILTAKNYFIITFNEMPQYWAYNNLKIIQLSDEYIPSQTIDFAKIVRSNLCLNTEKVRVINFSDNNFFIDYIKTKTNQEYYCKKMTTKDIYCKTITNEIKPLLIYN